MPMVIISKTWNDLILEWCYIIKARGSLFHTMDYLIPWNINIHLWFCMGFPSGSIVKNPPANAGYGFDPWVRKIPWRRAWQPTPIFSSGKSHGWRRLQSMGSQRVGHDWATSLGLGGCLMYRHSTTESQLQGLTFLLYPPDHHSGNIPFLSWSNSSPL